MNPHQVLGLKKSATEREIKVAYAKKIKQFRPDSHPVEFAKIRQAYESALQTAKWQAEEANQDAEVPIGLSADEAALNEQVDENKVSTRASIIAIETETATQHHQHSNLSNLALTALESEVRVEKEVEPYPIDNLISAYEQGGELAAVNAYQTLQARYSSKTLDAQMDLEDALLRHFLFGSQYALHVFELANEKYEWLRNQVTINQQYGDWAGRKLESLQVLFNCTSSDLI